MSQVRESLLEGGSSEPDHSNESWFQRTMRKVKMGRNSPYRLRFIDDKRGIPRFLASLVMMNLILNGLYYFTGPGVVVFQADHEKFCDFYSKDFNTYYYEPSLQNGDKITVLNDIRSIKFARQADNSFKISDGVSLFNRACIRADVLRGVKL